MAKYDPLLAYLADHPESLTMSFAQVAQLVGGLPPSADRWSAWWANDPGHVQARAWLNRGHRVESVELAARRVRFS